MLFWNVLVAVIICTIWAVAYFTGHETRTLDTVLFVALIVLELGLVVLGDRKQGNSGGH